MAALEEALRRLRANDGMVVSLWEERIGDAGAAAVAEALQGNNTLTTLSLGFNDIGATGAVAVVKALKENNTLTTLNLGFNSIGDAGAGAVVEALKGNNTLTTLSLGGNDIGAAGAAAAAEALKGNTALTALYLECAFLLRAFSLRRNNSGVLSLVAACSASFFSFSLSPFLGSVFPFYVSCISRMHAHPSRNSFWAR